MNTQVKITRWVNGGILALVVAFLFLLPRTLDVFNLYRPMSENARMALLGAYYCCAVPIVTALLSVERLLKEILAGKVFTVDNVKRIGRIRWCCLAVSLICLGGAWDYPSLVFLAVIMGFLALIVSVVVSVLSAAVAIREENDLTV